MTERGFQEKEYKLSLSGVSVRSVSVECLFNTDGPALLTHF